MEKNKITILIKSIFVLSIFTLAFSVSAIWVMPTSGPTANNPYPPFNISLAPQQKIGSLAVGQTGLLGESFSVSGPVILNDRLQIKPILDPNTLYILTSDSQGNASWKEIPGDSTNLTDSWERTTGSVSLKNVNDDVQIGNSSKIYKRFTGTDKLFIHTTSVDGDADIEGKDYFNLFMGIESGNESDFNLKGVFGNTALGFRSLYKVKDDDPTDEFAFEGDGTADHNTAVGDSALYKNIEGNGNTALGSKSLYSNTNGIYNTAVGYQSLNNITTGNYNTAVGNNSGPTSGSLNNTIALGNNVGVNESNTMVLGNGSVLGWSFGGATVDTNTELIRVGINNTNGNGAILTKTGQWQNASDRTKKHNIKNINYGLKEILKLRPVDFNWNGSNKKDIGFIAQEVKEILPEIVSGEEGKMTMSYGQVNAVLVKVIQEQQKEMREYRAELEGLQKRLEKLKLEVNN